MGEERSALALYLRALRRNVLLLVLLPVAAAGAAYAVTAGQEETYRAELKIVVGQGSGIGPQGNATAEAFNQTMSSLLESEIVARDVARFVGPRLSPEAFRRELRITSRPESSVLDVTWDAANPTFAVGVLQRLSSVFPRLLDTRLNAATTDDGRLTARVFDPPSARAEPISPRPLRSAVVAGVVGLMVALGIALLRDSLRKEPRHSRSVSTVVGEPA
jgi:capsular polysaccharide biosynthesis protein